MGTNHLKNSGERKIKIYHSSQISEDVLERLEGNEDFKNVDDLERAEIFRILTLRKIIKDTETNEDVKFLIKEILEDCEGCSYLKIHY